ncbi:MAG TPA: phosphate acyltransferase PlsX [Coriobacteriia bacterium]|nr:phosphate acyltransferase PlsX [Coriobacteriia bacterium]
MTESRSITVAVDAVGGDFAPDEILTGVALALANDAALRVMLLGPAEIVDPFASSQGARVTAVPTTDDIGMNEHPATAVRSKKDSSIVVGARLVKEKEADAFFSAGSTGAAMAAATLVMGRIHGVLRPAIATVLPTSGQPTVLLDVGATADCKPEHLVQFAHMGAAYAQTVLGVVGPRVALLNIGEEPTKGSQLAREAHVLMAKQVPGFVGNVEGRDVITGAADVIVTDGFTGNVALKLLEGTSKVLLGQVKEAMTSSAVNKAAAAVLKPAVTRLKERLDPDTYGGAPLLGVDGVCIIAHGSSKAKAVSNGIRVAAQAGRGGLTQQIAESISAS